MELETEDNVPISISHQQENFRLLELPPTLLELITSGNPPILQLKSASFNELSAGGVGSSAMLCTPTQTFEVRQVQSSNIFYILEPSSDVPVDAEDGVAVPSVSAIGQCRAMLEPSPAVVMATQHLKQVVPVYHRAPTFKEAQTKEEIIVDVPFSTGEFEHAWRDLCAFELDGRAWLPSAVTLRGIWNSFISSAMIKGTRITDALQIDDTKTLVEEDGYLNAQFQAVLRRISTNDDAIDGWATIDRDQCVPWLGAVLLEAHGHESIIASNFLHEWQDLLPETWRSHAKLDLIKDNFVSAGENTILFRVKTSEESCQNTAAKGASKWHEKFKNRK